MAFQGRISKPDSKRGLAANKGVIPEPIQDSIDAPAWLDDVQLSEFWSLVDLNRASGVSIRRVDAPLYADLADVMGRCRVAESDEMYLKLAKQVNELRAALNMGPRNRARAGVVDRQKPKAVNPMAALVRMPMASGE